MRDLISSISLALVGLAIVLEASRPLTAPPKVNGPSMAYYVALNGRDNWSGKLPSPNAQATDGPFATLERARDAIRALKQAGPLGEGGITVWIRGGRYYRDRTFELTAEDGGRADAPIAYRAYGTEEVRLIGGKEVADFTTVTDPTVLGRIDPPYRNKILQADLNAQGITEFGTLTPRGFGRPVVPAGLELFFQDRPMTLARWPNRGWAKISAVPAGPDGGKFCYDGDRPRRWSRADDIWIHGYWFWNWADSYEKVQSIDLENREIVTVPPHGVYGYKTGQRYYALNLLEELDEPGEWYLDRKTGFLYFWPPTPIADGIPIVSMLETPLIALKDVSYVTVQGLVLEDTRGVAVGMEGGNNDLISACMIRNVGTVGVVVGGGAGNSYRRMGLGTSFPGNAGRENGIAGCDIHETGEGAVILSGGDRETLTPAENFVVDSHIHHYSRWVGTVRPAVALFGVGNRIAHNLVHDAPHTAVLLHGNDHRVEYNDIHHVCMETADAGAFYMGRDFTERGNVVQYNYFHDFPGGDMQAIYLDDFASGTTVLGNICYRTGRGVLIGGGRDNVVENNVFVECNPAVRVDARGMTWAAKMFNGQDQTLIDRLDAVNFSSPPYSKRYPELAGILENQPAVPKGNRIEKNIAFGEPWLELRRPLIETVVEIRNNLTDGDPRFVDLLKGDFRLRNDSPAFRLGFQPIPMEMIGPRSGRQYIDVFMMRASPARARNRPD